MEQDQYVRHTEFSPVLQRLYTYKDKNTDTLHIFDKPEFNYQIREIARVSLDKLFSKCIYDAMTTEQLKIIQETIAEIIMEREAKNGK